MTEKHFKWMLMEWSGNVAFNTLLLLINRKGWLRATLSVSGLMILTWYYSKSKWPYQDNVHHWMYCIQQKNWTKTKCFLYFSKHFVLNWIKRKDPILFAAISQDTFFFRWTKNRFSISSYIFFRIYTITIMYWNYFRLVWFWKDI